MKDKEIFHLIGKEVERQEATLDLIASENIASGEVMAAVGSPLMNKYSEGYPGRRYYPGNEYYDEIELIAQARALRCFGLRPRAWCVNVQPYSGSPANLAVYTALMPEGGTLMGMALASGGHLTHGHKVSMTGRWWKAVQYGVDPKTELIDYAAVAKLARKARPQVIVSGFTAYPRRVDFKKFGEIAKRVGAYHVADISHIAGLVAAGVHPSPFPYADVVMTTTHKTLRGPRGAVIFANRKSQIANRSGIDLPSAIDKAIFPGLQGGPHNNATAGKAIAFFEVLQPSFRVYARQVVRNARALAYELERLGARVVAGGTDTHLLLLDARSFGIDGMTAERRLEEAGIVANRNSISGDVSPFKPSGLRLGTPSLTTRGMKEKEMRIVAGLIARALRDADVKAVARETHALAKRFPIFKKQERGPQGGLFMS
ncbi:MAG: serine hydroxymethyltransferase [bacterium]|nr:serine hydroxymethyltransferase [bacterium]